MRSHWGSWQFDFPPHMCVVGVWHSKGCLERWLLDACRSRSRLAVAAMRAGSDERSAKGQCARKDYCSIYEGLVLTWSVDQETGVRIRLVNRSRKQVKTKSKCDEIPPLHWPRFSDLCMYFLRPSAISSDLIQNSTALVYCTPRKPTLKSKIPPGSTNIKTAQLLSVIVCW